MHQSRKRRPFQTVYVLGFSLNFTSGQITSGTEVKQNSEKTFRSGVIPVRPPADPRPYGIGKIVAAGEEDTFQWYGFPASGGNAPRAGPASVGPAPAVPRRKPGLPEIRGSSLNEAGIRRMGAPSGADRKRLMPQPRAWHFR